MKQYNTKKFKKGFGLLETLMAIGITAILMVVSMQLMEERAKDLKDSLMSEQLKTLNDALNTFTKENYIALRDNAPQVFDTSVLGLGENYTRSPYGHLYRITTRRTGQAVDVALIAGDPTTDIDPYRIPNIAGMAGPKSGFFSTSTQGASAATSCGKEVCGAYGSWSTDLTGFAASGISSPQFASMITLGDMDVTAPYLYRDAIPGQPQLNRMNTNIDMAGNNINNTGTLSSQTISNSGTITTQNLSAQGITSASINNSGTILSQGNITTQGTLYSQSIQNSGSIQTAGLSSSESITTQKDIDATGTMSAEDYYIKKEGMWLKPFILSLLPKVSLTGKQTVGSGTTTITVPFCPEGKTPGISFMPRAIASSGTISAYGDACSAGYIATGDDAGSCYGTRWMPVSGTTSSYAGVNYNGPYAVSSGYQYQIQSTGMTADVLSYCE